MHSFNNSIHFGINLLVEIYKILNPSLDQDTKTSFIINFN